MTLTAGVDIGNSTTEIVVARDGVPLAWDSRPTRGTKGSPGSVLAAQALLRRIEREHQLRADRVVVAPWHPVTSHASLVREPTPDTTPLVMIRCASHSVVGDGWAVGIPWRIRDEAPQGPCIAIVDKSVGYADAATALNAARSRGIDIHAVLLEADEAVLVAHRLDQPALVIDGVDVALAARAEKLFVEVRPPGGSLSALTDSWALNAQLDLTADDAVAARTVAAWLADERVAVVGLDHSPSRSSQDVSTTELLLNSTWRNVFHVEHIATPGAVSAISIESVHRDVADAWLVDITAQLALRGIRGSSHSRSLAIADLSASLGSNAVNLESVFEREVSVFASEALAAGIGARTTPGATSDAVIVDIGGGTIDLIDAHTLSVAGAGALLTAAVAHVLEVPRGAADWIKRGPAVRVEAPTVWQTESGERTFTDEPTPATFVGQLACPGPAGPMAFAGSLPASDWRQIRHALKRAVIADNVERLVATIGHRVDVIAVGGPVADDELIPLLRSISTINAVGRGNVAGQLGHRYAVAYGLACG